MVAELVEDLLHTCCVLDLCGGQTSRRVDGTLVRSTTHHKLTLAGHFDLRDVTGLLAVLGSIRDTAIAIVWNVERQMIWCLLNVRGVRALLATAVRGEMLTCVAEQSGWWPCLACSGKRELPQVRREPRSASVYLMQGMDTSSWR